jgi:UDPglucose 6-dehydrogenase
MTPAYDIGIIGNGFVGGAYAEGFRKRGVKSISIYDPIKIPNSRIQDVLDTHFCFVCVPTPMGDGGRCVTKTVEDSCHKLEELGYAGTVVVKSTCIPDVIDLLYDATSLNFAANPEFLTERTAQQDVDESKLIVMGGDTGALSAMYEELWPDAEQVVFPRPGHAMLLKYMFNTFYATKVTLVNEFYRLAVQLGMIRGEWERVVSHFGAHPWVGHKHTDVPGPDGKFGYGGHCFPKDTAALTALARDRNLVMHVLESVQRANDEYRETKDEA